MTIKLKKVNKGKYETRYCGVTFTIVRNWGWNIRVEGDKLPEGFEPGKNYGTRANCIERLEAWGAEEVPTHNMMNGKPCTIARSLKGGCCDPATETYWSM